MLQLKIGGNMKARQPLLIIILLVISPLLFICGIILGHYLSGSQILTADSISSWVSAIATVAIAILTFILAKETWYLREVQIDQLEQLRLENFRPNVGFQLEHNPIGMNFMNVLVNNLGKGIGMKVKFSFYDENGQEILRGQNIVVDKMLTLPMFSQGIRSIGIGQTFSSFLFSFIDLKEELKDAAFDINFDLKITFEDVEGNNYENVFNIDFSQYRGISVLGKSDISSIYRISEEIEEIRKIFSNVTGSSSNRLKVDFFDSHDRENEEKIRREKYEIMLREAQKDIN